jgi:hypothetical protein
MINGKRPQFACAVPRDHAKTTLAKLACVWFILFSPWRFILYISNTHPIALNAVKDVKNFLLIENCVAVFGEPEFTVEQDGIGNYQFKLNGKVCILKALGAKSQVRGINVDNQRPELAIIDDLEDLDNTATPHLQLELRRWFYGTFKKAMDKFGHKIIQIGNLISSQSILHNNLNSTYWDAVKYGCLRADGTPLWKDAWPIEKLRQDYDEYQKAGMAHMWFAEMMNMPIPAGKGLITADEITYIPPALPSHPEYGFITIDPAISEQTWADRTAIVAHAWIDEYSCWMPVDYELERGMDPLQTIYKSLDMALRWGFFFIGVESIAYQAALVHFFKYIIMKEEWQHIVVEPIGRGGRASKTMRLSAWAGLLKSGDYKLPQGDFEITEQLLMYDPSKKKNDDDLIDSCAHGQQIINNAGYMAVIHTRNEGSKPVINNYQTSYEICGV